MGVGLEGLRVLDFGHYISGPLAALLLSDAGAEVIHVDRPGTELSNSPVDAFLNRGKRRVTLDLSHASDRATARDLAEHADVVIENFRPGVMSRLELGADELLAANPALVYCSLPGFGAWDPDREEAGWEGIVQAAVAGYRPLREHWDPTGRHRATVTDPAAPLFTPVPTASNFSGMLGALCVVMALIARERGSGGQHVEVPMVEAVAEAFSTMIGFRVYEAPAPAPNLMLPFMSHITSDGRLLDGSPYPKFVIRLLQAAGVAQEWERLGLIDIAGGTFRLDRRDEIAARFAALARSRSGRWWDDVAAAVNLPYAVVRTPTEWARCAHALESGAVAEFDDPVLGPILLPAHGFDLEHGPTLAPRVPPAPRQSDPARCAWASVTRSPGSTAGFGPDRPLDGFKAIDITQAVAGPTAARLLADFGAEVMKIGSPVPAVTDGIVGHLHNGKRTILMDIRAPEAAELKRTFFGDADIFVTNFSPSSALRYGIDPASLRAINPGLVYCNISAFGQTGPWAGRRAYENQNNAATGMSWRYGSQFGWALYQPSPITDAATGVLGAFAAAVALYRRFDTGVGQLVGSSLVQASTFQQGVLLAQELRQPDEWIPSHGEYGLTALYRLYRTQDRSLFIRLEANLLPALLQVLGLDMPSTEQETWPEPGGALASALERGFRARPADEWVKELKALRIDARAVSTIDEASEYLEERAVAYFEPGPDGTRIPRPSISSAWMSVTPPKRGANPAPVGSQVMEILEERGLTFEDIIVLNGADVICLPDQLPTIQRRT